MSKILFYTDIHLSGQTPRHRIDNFPFVLLEKLEEVYRIANERECDFVIFGGDLYNTHRIYSYDVIGGAQEIIKNSGLETWSVIGQHDLKGYNPDTLETSVLQFTMKGCENFHVIREPVEVGDCVLYASHVWDDIEKANEVEVQEGKCNILIAHHLLTSKKAMFDVVNTVEFSEGCPYQLVLSGDLHDGYEPHEANGVWFCNPGSLARRATNDANRMPQVAIIETDKGKPSIEIVRLECGKPGDEVFGEGIAEVIRKRDKDEDENFDADAFVQDMESIEMDSEDIHELVQKVGKEKGVDQKVMSYLATKKEEKKPA